MTVYICVLYVIHNFTFHMSIGLLVFTTTPSLVVEGGSTYVCTQFSCSYILHM